MTRQEYIDDIAEWSDLLSFCSDMGCEVCDNIYDDDSKDDFFNNLLEDFARDARDWRELRNALDDIPDGYDYYIKDDWDEFFGTTDDDFFQYKDEVMAWMDVNEYWDEDEWAQQEEEIESEEDCTPIEAEDITIEELFNSYVESKRQETEALSTFLNATISVSR